MWFYIVGSAYVLNTVIAAKSGKLSIKISKTNWFLGRVQIYAHLNYDENFSRTLMGYCAIIGIGSATFAMFYVIGRVKELIYSRYAETNKSQIDVKQTADQCEELSFISDTEL